MTNNFAQPPVTLSAGLVLIFHENGGIVEQATEIGGQYVPLPNFVPGLFYRQSGHPPLSMRHPDLGELVFVRWEKC